MNLAIITLAAVLISGMLLRMPIGFSMLVSGFAYRRVSSYLSPHSCGQPLNIVATRMRFDDVVTFGVESDHPNGRPVACIT